MNDDQCSKILEMMADISTVQGRIEGQLSNFDRLFSEAAAREERLRAVENSSISCKEWRFATERLRKCEINVARLFTGVVIVSMLFTYFLQGLRLLK